MVTVVTIKTTNTYFYRYITSYNIISNVVLNGNKMVSVKPVIRGLKRV